VLQAVVAEMAQVRLPVEPADVPRLAQEAPNFLRWGLRSLAELFDECGLGQKSRAVLAGESGDCATPPSRAPILLHAMLIDHYRKGACYPKGGGQMIPAHLVSHGVRANAGVDRGKQDLKRPVSRRVGIGVVEPNSEACESDATAGSTSMSVD